MEKARTAEVCTPELVSRERAFFDFSKVCVEQPRKSARGLQSLHRGFDSRRRLSKIDRSLLGRTGACDPSERRPPRGRGTRGQLRLGSRLLPQCEQNLARAGDKLRQPAHVTVTSAACGASSTLGGPDRVEPSVRSARPTAPPMVGKRRASTTTRMSTNSRSTSWTTRSV